MPSDLYYWDSCVFVSYVNDDPDRVPDIEHFLEESTRGTIRIVTSVITISEVAWASSEKENALLDPEVEKKIDALWTPRGPILLVEYHRQIGLGARDLMRYAVTQGWQLRPIDAIHLSTARFMEAGTIHTYSGDFSRWADVLGCSVEEPESAVRQLPTVNLPEDVEHGEGT